MPLPRLSTARLSLVPVSDDHLELLVGLNSDPAVMRYLLGRAATPDETLAEWEQRRRRQSDESRGLGYWIGSVAADPRCGRPVVHRRAVPGSPDLRRDPPGVAGPPHSHSIVPGGFEVMSRVTRLTSATSLVMRVEIRSITS